MRRRKLGGMDDGTLEKYRYKSVKELIEDGPFEPPDLDDGDNDADIQREIEQSMVSFSSIDLSQYSKVSY